MRVLVLEAAAGDQRVGVLQRLDHRVVGVALVALVREHALALEARRLAGEGAVGVDGEGDGGVDAARDQRGLARHPDLEVVAAVAGRGVHKTGAVLVGDVIAVEEGDIEAIALATQRMRTWAAARSFPANSSAQLEGIYLRRLHNLLGQLLGDDQPVAGLGPIAVGGLA